MPTEMSEDPLSSFPIVRVSENELHSSDHFHNPQDDVLLAAGTYWDPVNPIFIQEKGDETMNRSLWKVEFLLGADPNANCCNATDLRPFTAFLMEGNDHNSSPGRFRRGCALRAFETTSMNAADMHETNELSSLLYRDHGHGMRRKLRAMFISPVRMYRVDAESITQREDQPKIFEVQQVKPPFEIAFECGKLCVSHLVLEQTCIRRMRR